MKKIDGGITAVPGFLAAGVSSGIKKDGKLDLALIYSEKESVSAGLFTTNRFMAAPLLVTKKRVAKGKGQAIIASSGNANACTGWKGYLNAKEMAMIAAKELSISEDMVYVASTGIIGVPMPMDNIRQGIPEAVKKLCKDKGKDAALAIMTTDTFSKEVAVQEKIGDRMITVGGIAKGSGMIHPNMATMLSFLGTDAVINRSVLQEVLSTSVDRSFNMITVDGDKSTNDMVVCLANGMAGNSKIGHDSAEMKRFQVIVEFVCTELAKMIVRDGEGTTKFVEVRVTNARDYTDAKKVAFAIANSNLVKTAFFGQDANWGRIMAAIGASGVDVEEDSVDIYYGDIKLVERGEGTGSDKDKLASEVLKNKDITIRVNLNSGDMSASVWTTDLSYEYIKINTVYRT